eukprot:429089_1
MPANPKPKEEAEIKDVVPFPSRMTLDTVMQLSVGDKIDYRDSFGRFLSATVLEKNGSTLKIHCDRWVCGDDVWSDINTELHRFAPVGSISLRPSHRPYFSALKKGDYVDFGNGQSNWKAATIIGFDTKHKSGQVQVRYHDQQPANLNLYWTHLDNVDEIAPFATKSREPTYTKAWEPIDIIKALLWDSDGKSLPWIARQLGTDKYDVKRKIIREKKKKEMEMRKEINQKQQQNNKENTHAIGDTTRKHKLEQTKDDNLNEPPNKKIKLNKGEGYEHLLLPPTL